MKAVDRKRLLLKQKMLKK